VGSKFGEIKAVTAHSSGYLVQFTNAKSAELITGVHAYAQGCDALFTTGGVKENRKIVQDLNMGDPQTQTGYEMRIKNKPNTTLSLTTNNLKTLDATHNTGCQTPPKQAAEEEFVASLLPKSPSELEEILSDMPIAKQQQIRTKMEIQRKGTNKSSGGKQTPKSKSKSHKGGNVISK